MTDSTEEIIREIALKHGVALGRDDPILILQTLNEKLWKDSGAAQKAILDQFKSEMEALAFQWREDARMKAERSLNAALQASKQVLQKAPTEPSALLVKPLPKEVSQQIKVLEKLVGQLRFMAWLLF